MIQAYLLVNGVLYVLFAIACALFPEKSAALVGFSFRSGSGRSEFITVYGGLEMAMGVFFLIAGLSDRFQTAGLLFALCLYGCLVVFRVPTLILVPGIERATFIFASLELLLGVAAALLWWKARAPA